MNTPVRYTLAVIVVLAGAICAPVFAERAPVRQPGVTSNEMVVFNRSKDGVVTPAAREQLAALRTAAPDSFVPPLCDGLIAFNNGDFPRALWHLSLARQRLELYPNYSALADDEAPQWHALVMWHLAETYRFLRRYDLQRSVLAAYTNLNYDSYVLRLRNKVPFAAWQVELRALLAMGATQEASAVLASARAMPGLNNAENADLELLDLRTAFASSGDSAAALARLRSLIATAPSSTLQREAAFHALRCLHYSDAQTWLLDSTRRPNFRLDTSQPWLELAKLYTQQGRWLDARAALQQAYPWLRAKSPHIRIELDKDLTLGVAQFYIAAGYQDRALHILRPLRNKPVRASYTASSADQWIAGWAVTYAAAARQARWLARCYPLPLSNAWHVTEWHMDTLFNQSLCRRKLRAALLKQHVDNIALRDALAVAYLPPWMWHEMPRLLSSAQVENLLRILPLTGRQAEVIAPVLHLYCARWRGDWPTIAASAPHVLKQLPAEEAILIAQVQVMLAEALRRSDTLAPAMQHFAAALATVPAAFAHMEIPVPLDIAASRLPSDLATIIRNMPCVLPVPGGFTLAVLVDEADKSAISVTMPQGTPLVVTASDTDPIHALVRALSSSLPPMTAIEFAQAEGRTPPRPKP